MLVASNRECAPSLTRTLWIWVRAVLSEIASDRAICLVDCPSIISISTSCSRKVSSRTSHSLSLVAGDRESRGPGCGKSGSRARLPARTPARV